MVAECIQCFARVTTITYEKVESLLIFSLPSQEKDQEYCLNIIYS